MLLSNNDFQKSMLNNEFFHKFICKKDNKLTQQNIIDVEKLHLLLFSCHFEQ